MNRRWPLYGAMAITALVAVLSGALAMFPVGLPQEIEPAPTPFVAPAGRTDLADGYLWGLTTGVLLTAVMLLAAPRLRRRR